MHVINSPRRFATCVDDTFSTANVQKRKIKATKHLGLEPMEFVDCIY